MDSTADSGRQEVHEEPESFNNLEYCSSDEEDEGSDHDQPDDDASEDEASDGQGPLRSPRIAFQHRRRLSTFESSEGGMDLESDVIGGSARSFSYGTLPRGYGSVRGPRRSRSGTSV